MDLTSFTVTVPSTSSGIIMQAMDKNISRDKNVDIVLEKIRALLSIANYYTHFLAEMCAEKSIEIIQPCLPDIFAGSRSNPFRHAELTYEISELNQRVKRKDSSIALAAMQEDIETIYMHMLKLRLVPKINLTTLPELDLHIASLLLRHRRDDYPYWSEWKEQASAVRNLFCIHDLTQRLPPLDGALKIQQEANLQAYAKVIAKVATMANPQIVHNTHHFVHNQEECKALMPHLHCYSSGMLFPESEILSTNPHLTELELCELSHLPKLLHPEKVQTLKISNRSSILKADARLLTTFLTRCKALESLIIETPDSTADLYMLPRPEKLKTLSVTYFDDYTAEFLAKFVNLEELCLHFHEGEQSIDGLATLPKLRELCINLNGIEIETWLQAFPRCHNVDTLKIANRDTDRTQWFDDTILTLLLDKFPKLKTLIPLHTFHEIEDWAQKLKERGITLYCSY